MIYLASPYTHPESAVRQARYELTVTALAIFLKQGELVYSPIVHTHASATLFNLPKDYQYWLEFNMHFLNCSSGLYILCIDGWEHSLGVRSEIDEAARLGLPIKMFRLEEDTLKEYK